MTVLLSFFTQCFVLFSSLLLFVDDITQRFGKGITTELKLYGHILAKLKGR